MHALDRHLALLVGGSFSKGTPQLFDPGVLAAVYSPQPGVEIGRTNHDRQETASILHCCAQLHGAEAAQRDNLLSCRPAEQYVSFRSANPRVKKRHGCVPKS